LNSAAHLEKVAGYVEAAKARGIAIAAGGARTVDPQSGQGWFFRNRGRADVTIRLRTNGAYTEIKRMV